MGAGLSAQHHSAVSHGSFALQVEDTGRGVIGGLSDAAEESFAIHGEGDGITLSDIVAAEIRGSSIGGKAGGGGGTGKNGVSGDFATPSAVAAIHQMQSLIHI